MIDIIISVNDEYDGRPLLGFIVIFPGKVCQALRMVKIGFKIEIRGGGKP